MAISEDQALCVSINVPLPVLITPDELVEAFRCAASGGGPPADAKAAHLDRLLSEMPLASLLRFCDRHGFGFAELRAAYLWHRARGGAPSGAIEAHLAGE
jgi:hypothetical protein